MRWYVERSGKTRGPFDEDAVRSLIANGKIDNSCRLRGADEAVEAWRPLDEVTELLAPFPINPSLPDGPPLTTPLPLARLDRTTVNIERSEKVGRLLLWLALAVTIVLVPIGLAKERRNDADTQQRVKEATRASEEKLAAVEKSFADKTARIDFGTIGNGLTSLNTDNATGQLWFTNVSPRAGYVCVVGEATNASTHGVTLSLPACAEVSPYASAVHMTVLFAGGDLIANCKTGGCDLHVRDAPSMKL